MQKVARGRPLAAELIARAQPRAAALARARKRPAVLAIVAADDADGRRFVRIKQDALRDVAIDIRAAWLPRDCDTARALRVIAELNGDAEVDGIFLQFPLPAGVEAQRVADAVALHKDVDCSGASAERSFLQQTNAFVPVAPQAALHLLQAELGDLGRCKVSIPAADEPFARALQALLLRAGAQVLSGIEPVTAAIVVTEELPASAALAVLKHCRVLLDAGYYLPPRPPGWLAEPIAAHVATHLTQYGNVGPLTVAYLAQATLLAGERNRGA